MINDPERFVEKPTLREHDVSLLLIRTQSFKPDPHFPHLPIFSSLLGKNLKLPTMSRVSKTSSHQVNSQLKGSASSVHSSRLRAVLLLTAVLFIADSVLSQSTFYWDTNDSTTGFGTAGGTWADPTTNNSTQGWSTSSNGTFSLSGTTNTTTSDALNFGTGTATYGLGAGTITVSGTVSANSLTFGSQSGAIILSGGTISLGGTTPTITVNNAADTISSAITGSAGLTKNGTGTLTLSGNNTYTGPTTLNAGKLSVGNNSAFGTSSVVVNSSSVILDSAAGTSYTLSNNITLNTRSTIGATAAMGNLTLGGIISGTGDLKVDTTAGATTLTGLNTFTGNLIVDRATEGLSFNSIANAGVASAVGAGSSISLGVGASTPTFTYTGNTAASSNRSISLNGGGAYIISRNAPLTLSGNVTSTSQSLVLQGNAGGGANFNELSGNYSGGGSLNVQTSTGDVWKISGNNTYTGITYSQFSATTIAGHSNAFGSTVNGTQVTQNSQILLADNISVGAEALTLNSAAFGSWNGQTGAALRSYSGNNSWAGAITLGQATTIATNSGAGLTLSGGITGTNQNLIFNSIGNTIASGNIATGTGTLTKSGAGTLTLSGNNTYTGVTTVSAGTLEVGSAGLLGAGNYTQNIVNNGTFIYSGTSNQSLSGIISGAGAITQNAASTLMLLGNNTYTGATALNAGMIQIGHASGLGVGGNITFAGGGLQYGSGMTVDVSSRLKNSASAILIDTNGNNVTFASAVGSTNSGGLTKNGTGTLTLTNANSYSGGTTINAGTINATNSSALGSGNVSVAAGGKLEVSANNLTIANNITLNGTTTNGAIYSNQPGAGVTTNLTGQITLNATSNVSSNWNDKTLQLSGKITGVGGLDFVLHPGQVGGRYLITGATNDYAGATSVTGNATGQWGYTGQAMLYLGATNALPTTTALTLNYADLYLNGQAQTLASISGSGNFSVQNGSTTAATLTLGSGNTTSTLSGTIKNNGISVTNTAASPATVTGTVALTKIGTGTLTLSGNNTYTGVTTLNAGMIQIGHASGLGVGGNITFGGGGLQYGSGMTVDVSSSLKNSASAILIDTNGNNVTFASAVDSTNSGGLTKNGTGTLTINSSSTFSGAKTINAGTLRLAAPGTVTIYGGNSTVNINNGSTLQLGFVAGMANNPPLTGLIVNIDSSGGGTVALDGINGLVQSSAGVTFNTNGGAQNSLISMNSGGINDQGGNRPVLFNVASGSNATADFLVAGGMTQGAITKNGTGKLLFNNTAVGTTRISDININQGTMEFGGTSTLNQAAGFVFANNGTLAWNSTANQTLSNNITGTGSLVKSNTSTLTLSGNNSYTGTSTLNGGTISISHANGLGTTGNITFGGGGLQYGASITTDLSSRFKNSASAILINTNSNNVTFASAVDSTNSGGLTKNGTGTLTLSGNNTYTGPTTIGAGTLEIGASSRLGAGNYTQNIVNNGTFIYSGTSNQTLSGIISGTGSLIQNGVGSTLTINSSSTFSGAKTINAGTLRLAAPGTVTIYGGNSTVNINNGSTLQLGFVAGMANNPPLTGLIVNIDSSGGGTVALDGINGLVQSSAGVTFNTNGGAQNSLISMNSGGINDQGGNRPVLFNVASGSNATADFLVAGGMTQGAITKNGTGKLLFNNTAVGTTRISDININQGTMEFGGTSTLNQAAGFVFANNGTLAWNSTANQTLSNNITGTGSLVKSNTSTLTLSGNNTYSGATTVNAGTLAVSGNISSSAVTVNSGGVISAGSAAAVTKFNAASLTLSADSGYAFTIGNISGGTAGTAGTDYDQIATSGALTFNNTLSNPFTVYLNGTPTNWSSTGNYTWNIMSGSSISGFSSANFFANTSGFGSSLDAGSAWTFGTSGGNLTLTYNVSAVPTWSGGTGTWSTGFTPGLSNDANMLFTGAGGNATNDIASGTFNSIGTLTFNSTAGSYTLAANSGSAGNGSSLAIGNSIVNNSANAQTINTDLSFAAIRIINTASGNISVGGVISGAGALSKSGSSTLTLSGNNTYSGGTTLSAGTISVTNANGLGNGSVTAAANTKLFLAPSTGNMTIANAITLAGGGLGSIEVSGTVTTTGLITLTGGTDFRGSSLIIGGGITSANNSALSLNPTTTVNSTISIGTGDFTISSATTRINTAGNTFGNTTINFNGNLTLGINNALPSSTKVRFGFSSAVNSVATLNLNSYNQTVASLEGASGNYDTQNQNITGGGVLTVNQIAAQAFSYGGRITDGVTATSLTKNGSGTLMLQNWSGINSSYSGATTINAGTLMILAGNGTSLSASSAYTIASGAVLSVNGTSQRIGSLAGAGTVQNGNATTATTLTVGLDNTSTTFSGILQNGGAAALALTKNGSGALTLSGNNTYTGATTVNAGTLLVNGSLAAGSAVTVASGATLGGTGTLNGATTVNGNLAPGNSPGVLSFGSSLSLGSTAQTTMELNGTIRGTGYDGINVTGNLTYGGSLTIHVGSQFLASSESFSLFTFASESGALYSVSLEGAYGSEVFANNSGAWSATDSSGNQWSFSETTGNLGFTAVPEPSTVAFIVLGFVGILVARFKVQRKA